MATGDRETLEVDVLFVGGGPAGLAGAIRLRQVLKAHNETLKQQGKPPLELSVALLEKGREIGSHGLSGAVLDPRALVELYPDFERLQCPLESPVTDDAVWFLTTGRRLPLPIVPPPLRNHGNHVTSLGRLVRWLAARAEAEGVDLFPGFAATEVLVEEDRVVGVRTGDKGIDRQGKRKANFEPGIDIRAKITVIAEGPRGSLAKQLIDRFHLDAGRQPQVYSLGIKEVWECPKGSLPPGRVVHTMGFPLDSKTFGGGFIYHMADDLIDIGLVIGLDYARTQLDLHGAFQRFKTHPAIRPMLQGARLVGYGAKSIPEGGWYSIPRPYVAGCLIVGDSASMLNAMRLKGIHIGMKSGMLAGEVALESIVAADLSEAFLARYEDRFRSSWAGAELRGVRNFHAGFKHGLWAGMLHTAAQMVTGGRGFVDPLPAEAGHERLRRLGTPGGDSRRDDAVGPRHDDPLMIDKLTDVFHSGTKHEEDQPVHLIVRDTAICTTRCTEEYGNPCQHFCPAAVYEMVAKDGARRLQINASNCVHCKTCDIMDPYQIITWVPPEGGGGPEYVRL